MSTSHGPAPPTCMIWRVQCMTHSRPSPLGRPRHPPKPGGKVRGKSCHKPQVLQVRVRRGAKAGRGLPVRADGATAPDRSVPSQYYMSGPVGAGAAFLGTPNSGGSTERSSGSDSTSSAGHPSGIWATPGNPDAGRRGRQDGTARFRQNATRLSEMAGAAMCETAPGTDSDPNQAETPVGGSSPISLALPPCKAHSWPTTCGSSSRR
jgi:hypothetical protein